MSKKSEPSAADASDPGHGMIKSLQKALAVLEDVGKAEVPPRVADVARTVGVSRPTAYRIVQTLLSEGYLSQDAQSGRLSIGYSVLQQSARLLDSSRIRLEALPYLQELAAVSGERTNLGIIHQYQVLYLAGVEKPTLPTIYSRFGKTAPAHCCSLGKAILAHLPEEEVRELLVVQPLVPQTPRSHTDPHLFFEELALIREQGFAVDREEHMPHSFCVAATIFNNQGRAVGAIGISGKKIESVIEHESILRNAAEAISHVL